MYAELAIYQAAVQRTFHYAVPEDMPVSIGQLVEVSFRTALSQGIVLDIADHAPIPHPKPILDLLSPEPVVTPVQIALARWMAERTLSPIGACLWLMLPPGLARRSAVEYTLIDHDSSLEADSLAGMIVSLLRERGPLRAAQIDRALPRTRWRAAVRPLVAKGILRAEPVLPPPDARSKVVKTAWLVVPPEEVIEIANHLQKSPKQAAVLNFLAGQTEPVEIGWIVHHTGASYDSIRRLANKGLIAIGQTEQIRDPLTGHDFPQSVPPPLTEAQAANWAVIRAQMDRAAAGISDGPHTFLLHGVTGSGKTEIYLRAIEHVLAQRRGAIVLVPEISLVAPTVERFASRFPRRVAVVHSGLTDGEQFDTWRRARAGQIDIVIGARSALFTPLPDVGLIVIDEEHDDSYKQSPPLPPPYYHAREAASAMMHFNRGTVILGSATPDVTTTFRAHLGEIVHLRLPNRIIIPRGHADGPTGSPIAESVVAWPLPPIEVIDMRAELRGGNRSMFSRALRAALQETLARGEQAIMFLNRRGSATFVLCRDCGYVARCPRCDIPLTYYAPTTSRRVEPEMQCHYCGYHAPPPATCPQCASKRIRYFGAGTASVEEAITAEFEEARVLRWDRDTAHERGAHEAIWRQFAAGEANVLVGTQMIVKGLDLPRVTLVGVVLADTALGLPDYRAGERTFQLLTQAAGRAGRGWRGGRAIFQTYQPEHYAIRAASLHDYKVFYDQEVEFRRMLQYPPYKRLVRLLFRAQTAQQAEREAEAAAELLRRNIHDAQLTATELVGPAPAHFSRLDNVHQWHILARTTDPARLLDNFNPRQGWIVDVDPVDIL